VRRYLIWVPVVAGCTIPFPLDATPPPIEFVQGTFNAAGFRASPTVETTFLSPQEEGDLNVVVVGWDNPIRKVTAVTDTSGNSYLPLAPATSAPGLNTVLQAMYYAPAIRPADAGQNVVSVTFDDNTGGNDIRIAQYTHVGAEPLNMVVSMGGTGTTLDSGELTTDDPEELLVTGVTACRRNVDTAIPDFTVRVVSQFQAGEGTGGVLADQLVKPGPHAATGMRADTVGDCWVMQLAAFTH
jgi:hypothetical protein